MSVRDIFEQFKTLPVNEQRELKVLVDTYSEAAPEQAGENVMTDEMFQRAKEHVFANYGPLLEHLAK